MSPVAVAANAASMDTTSVNKSYVGDLPENTGVACSAVDVAN